ncbi:unnamed protein product [Arabidopsis halleri]
MFTLTKFNFRHREQNSCANLLAKNAIICNKQWFMYHTCPNFLIL